MTSPVTVKVLNGTPAPGATAPPCTIKGPTTLPWPASVPPAFTATVPESPPSTTNAPLFTLVKLMLELLVQVQAVSAFTSSVPKFKNVLLAVPWPSSTSLLIAPPNAPCAAPFNTDPVCSVSVLVPVPVNCTDVAAPEIVPALVTEPAP